MVTNDPPPKPTDHETDLNALFAGYITVTPLQFDMTKQGLLGRMTQWGLTLVKQVEVEPNLASKTGIRSPL